MNKALFNLSQTCRTLLQEKPGPEGRKLIAAHLQDLLTDAETTTDLVPFTAGERDLLYQDPELGFCILAHNYADPKTTSPHDHGPSWAIYAQVRGETPQHNRPQTYQNQPHLVCRERMYRPS